MAEHTFAGMTCTEVADLAPAYVLGALERAESDAVRRHLAECPEAHPEMAELHSVVPALFEVVEPVAPPAGLKDRILTAAVMDAQRLRADEQRGDEHRAVDQVPVDPTAVDTGVTGRPRPSAWIDLFRRPVWAAVSVAAAIAVLVVGYWNVQLQREIDVLSAYRQGVVEVIEQAAAPGAQLAVLAPPEGSGPTGVAAVGADGTVALVMRDLAPTTGTEVYEAWIIAGDAAPVPIGEFTVAAGGLGSFRTSQPEAGAGIVVALSLEPGPNSTTPTTVVAVGQARGQAS